MPDIAHMQEVIAAEGLDGWLLFDFRRSNLIAHRVLGLPPHAFFSRRWMYYIPAQGAPTRLVSAVEAHVLDMLPGERRVYRTWREYQALLGEILTEAKRVAMEYVPDNGIPYVSLVDAGTVELVRSLGPEVVSSADFTQRFEAVLTPAQIESHREAGRALLRARNGIFDWLRDQLSRDAELTEYAVQQEFSRLMRAERLHLDPGEDPLCAVNGNAGNPHYSPTAARHSPVRKGDLLLLDFSARMPGDESVVADYTWMTYLGTEPLRHHPRRARRRNRPAARALRGWEAGRGLGSRRRRADGSLKSGLRRRFRASDRPQHRDAGAWQRRASG
jgi:Xaa-Pro aminopeptidase